MEARAHPDEPAAEHAERELDWPRGTTFTVVDPDVGFDNYPHRYRFGRDWVAAAAFAEERWPDAKVVAVWGEARIDVWPGGEAEAAELLRRAAGHDRRSAAVCAPMTRFLAEHAFVLAEHDGIQRGSSHPAAGSGED